jgi:hypothetical protein
VIGLILLVGSPPGRLLLVVLAGSLVPYALTWKIGPGWRFTEHAYPFFLIAACFAICQVARLASASRLLEAIHARPDWRRAALWGSVLGAIAMGAWLVLRAFPFLIVREALAANEDVTIVAGERDGAFFGPGWSRPLTRGAVTARPSEGGHSVVRLPLTPASDYDLTMRLDPFVHPAADAAGRLPTVRILVNDHLVATFGLRWNPERVGAYEVRVPRSVTTSGVNRLVLVPEARPDGSDRVMLWYVRIRPVRR